MARVSGEQIAEKPVANVMDALQGKVAGMSVLTTSGDPNAVASVQIHGAGSLTAGSTPLYLSLIQIFWDFPRGYFLFST